jgi:hypothetical protein
MLLFFLGFIVGVVLAIVGVITVMFWAGPRIIG